MPKNPINKILIRMFFYGMGYGSLTSGLFFATRLFTTLQLSDVSNFLESGLISAFIFGLPIGLVVGGFAGLLSGATIIIVLDLLLSRRSTLNFVRPYRLWAGVVTLCMCVLVFSPLFGILWLISISTYTANHTPPIGFVISLGIAVYASQRTITRYIRDIDPRKSKVKYADEKGKRVS